MTNGDTMMCIARMSCTRMNWSPYYQPLQNPLNYLSNFIYYNYLSSVLSWIDSTLPFLLPSLFPGAKWPLGVMLYPIPLTNIVIISPIHFISHCPLGQYIHAFMHWGHDYHSMFPLHLLFSKARRGYHLGTELMAKGNPLLKRILQTLCHWIIPIQKSSL